MQRPCFAVAILLAWMAGSLVVVSRVESRSRERQVANLPSPRSVCHFESAGGRTIVLGQSAAISEEVTGEAGAVEPLVNRWYGIHGTGYDAAYDFAMLDGSYPDLARSTVDIEHSMAATEVADQFVGDSELEEYFYQASADPLPPSANQVAAVEIPALEMPASFTLWGVAVSLRDLPEQAHQWVAGELRQIGVWVETHDLIRPLASWSQAQLAELAWLQLPPQPETPVARVATVELLEFEWTEGPGASELGVDYTDEVALITAADTLEMLSAKLEIAAERLRYWAATRMVEKSHARRIAHRPE